MQYIVIYYMCIYVREIVNMHMIAYFIFVFDYIKSLTEIEELNEAD